MDPMFSMQGAPPTANIEYRKFVIFERTNMAYACSVAFTKTIISGPSIAYISHKESRARAS